MFTPPSKLVSDRFNESIESHASTVYTEAIFKKIQNEIRKALSLCFQHTVDEYEDHRIHKIVYKNHKTETKSEIQVITSLKDDTTVCSCYCFNDFRFLCCHIFRVFLDKDVKEIPEKYIKDRWRKNLIGMTNYTIKY